MAEEQKAETSKSDRFVVIAIDASEHSLHAFNYYLQYLHQPDNSVVLLFCPELSHVALQFLKGKKSDFEEWEKVMAKEKSHWEKLQEKYEALIKENNLSNGIFEVATSEHNKPGEAIVHYAEQMKATMVVMGTHGHGALRRTIMGSVSDYVVHHAHCPVIVCREHK